MHTGDENKDPKGKDVFRGELWVSAGGRGGVSDRTSTQVRCGVSPPLSCPCCDVMDVYFVTFLSNVHFMHFSLCIIYRREGEGRRREKERES